MKQSTLKIRKRFEQKKATRRFKNWKLVQRYCFQGNRCAWCKKTLNGEVHIDHVRPISHYRSEKINNYNNLVISCKTCNKLKSDQTGFVYPEWILRRKQKCKIASYSDLIKIAEEIRNGRNGRN